MRGVWGWCPTWSAKPVHGRWRCMVSSILTTPLQKAYHKIISNTESSAAKQIDLSTLSILQYAIQLSIRDNIFL